MTKITDFIAGIAGCVMTIVDEYPRVAAAIQVAVLAAVIFAMWG